MSSWIHGANPIGLLKVDENIEYVKRQLEAGPFFQNLVKKHILENRHSVTLGQRSFFTFLYFT